MADNITDYVAVADIPSGALHASSTRHYVRGNASSHLELATSGYRDCGPGFARSAASPISGPITEQIMGLAFDGRVAADEPYVRVDVPFRTRLKRLTMRWSERRTAVRSTFEMTSTLPLRATRALVRRRSSCSR